MITIRKTAALFISMGISIFGFSQLNLGLQSTTSAAIHATTNTAAILQTTQAASAATKSTVRTTSAQIKTTTQKTTGTEQTTTNNTMPKVGEAATANASVSSRSNVTAANSSATTDISNGNSADLKTGASISHVNLVGNTGSSTSVASDKIQTASGSALNTGEEIKTHLQEKTKSTIAAGEEKVKASSPSPAVSANARTESKTTIVK